MLNIFNWFPKRRKILTVILERNKLIDVINNLKKTLQLYDDFSKPCRYVETNLLVFKANNDDYLLTVRLDRMEGEKKLNVKPRTDLPNSK